MFYRLLELVLAPILRLVFRPWVEGLENVPEDGPALLVSNHVSFSDSFLLPLVLRRKVTFLAKAEYFTGRGVKGRLKAGFFRGAGQIPIDRGNGRAAEAALSTGLRVLKEGGLLGIYAEGTRSPDGRLYRGRTGVARLALGSGVPVVPCAMIGTYEIMPLGQKIPRIRRVGVRIGEPLDFSRYEGMETDRYVLRSVTDELMYRLMRLSGQEYVDVYATRAKAEIAKAGRAARQGSAPDATAAESPAARASDEDSDEDGAPSGRADAQAPVPGPAVTEPEAGAVGVHPDAAVPMAPDRAPVR